MRLICLNVWGGRKFKPLSDFIRKMSPETDIFCFQEVYDTKGAHRGGVGVRTDLFRELNALLPDFDSSFAPMILDKRFGDGNEADVFMGGAIFFRKTLHSLGKGSFFAYGSLSERSNNEPHSSGLLQYETFEAKDLPLTVCNFHGIATWPKSDNMARLEQSKKILEFLDGVDGHRILCGDLNLFPNTKSIAVLGYAMKNLTEEFKIKTTRSRETIERYNGQIPIETVSDYMFLSPEIRVNSFSVPEIEISDHLPLVLDFSI